MTEKFQKEQKKQLLKLMRMLICCALAISPSNATSFCVAGTSISLTELLRVERFRRFCTFLTHVYSFTQNVSEKKNFIINIFDTHSLNDVH